MSNTSERPVEIIAYHGWGMIAEFWNEWDDLLPDHVSLIKNDRGYFKRPRLETFSDKKAYRVLFVEGFGAHWVPEEEWGKAHLIVLFSAFRNLKDIMQKNRQVDEVVRSLKERVQEQVYHTMDLFWDEAFKGYDHSRLKPKGNLIANRELLMKDLDVYYDDIIDDITVREKAKIVMYETQYDSIMTHPQKKVIRELFGNVHYYKQMELVGHAFPFSHARECYKDLSSVVKIF